MDKTGQSQSNKEDTNKILKSNVNKVIQNYGESFNNKDKIILNYLLTKENIHHKEYHTIADIATTVKSLQKISTSYNNKVKTTKTEFTQKIKHEDNQIIYLDLNVKYNNYYKNPLATYYYLSYPNSLLTGSYIYNLYNKRSDPGIKKGFYNKLNNILNNPIERSTISYSTLFKFNDYQATREVALSHALEKNVDLDLKLYRETSIPELESKRKITGVKASITKSFNCRPYIFSNYAYFDSPHSLSLELSKEKINHEFNHHTPPHIKELIPLSDNLASIGLVYRKAALQFADLNLALNNKEKNSSVKDNLYNLEFSVKYKLYKANDKLKNTTTEELSQILNSTHPTKTMLTEAKQNEVFDIKLFLRKFLIFENFIWQSNLELRSLLYKKDTKLLIHQLLQVNDFKGIDKYEETDVNCKRKSPEIFRDFNQTVGFNSSYKWYNKIYLTGFFNSNALEIEDYDVDKNDDVNYYSDRKGLSRVMSKGGSLKDSKPRFLPFVHFNMMFIPYLNERKKLEIDAEDSIINSNLKKVNNYGDYYFSSGFGLAYISEHVALEAFYNGIVRQNENKLTPSFGFNIGID